MEMGGVRRVIDHPVQEYTRKLLASVLSVDEQNNHLTEQNAGEYK